MQASELLGVTSSTSLPRGFKRGNPQLCPRGFHGNGTQHVPDDCCEIEPSGTTCSKTEQR